MKAAFVLSTLFAGATAFGVAPPASTFSSSTSRSALIAEEDMNADQLKIKEISDKWNEIRHMSKEEAASLDGEWKEAYDRFFEKYDSDMEKMEEISTKLQKMIEPPKVQKKTKGQRKRDAFAKKEALAAARAAKV